MKRVVTAFIAAPIIPAVLFGITMAVLGLVASWGVDPPSTYIASIPIWTMFALPVSYLAAALFGVPVFVLMRRVGWLSIGRIATAASIIGLVIGVFVAAIFGSITGITIVFVLLAFAIFGAATGGAFWYLAKSKEPSGNA